MSRIKKEMEGYRFNDNDKLLDEEYYYLKQLEDEQMYFRCKHRKLQESNEGEEVRAARTSRKYPSVH